jgi:hypothetical protein
VLHRYSRYTDCHPEHPAGDHWVPCAIIEALNAGLQKMAGDFSMAYLDLYPLFLTLTDCPSGLF